MGTYMHATRPKLWMKKILKESGYDPANYLYANKTPDNLIFREKTSGKLIYVRY